MLGHSKAPPVAGFHFDTTIKAPDGREADRYLKVCDPPNLDLRRNFGLEGRNPC